MLATQRIGFLERLHSPEHPVLVFDGATGTSLQQMDLGPDDFGGAALEGCNENLVFTRPDAVQAVHRQFLEAGCDVIETDTFGATSLVLAEYDIADQTFALNKRAAELAREVAAAYSTPDKPRFVAGSMGPTTKLPTLGHIDFDTMKASFAEQAEGLLAGDVDLFIVETCQDPLQLKAAGNGVKRALAEAKLSLPTLVTVTVETTGTLLVEVLGEDAAQDRMGHALAAAGLPCWPRGHLIAVDTTANTSDADPHDLIRDTACDLGIGLARIQVDHRRIEDVFREGGEHVIHAG